MNVKSDICRHFSRAGHCKFGNSCRFVHEILKSIPEVMCTECGTIHKGMPIERCLHTGESGERRRGGWSSELSKWVCCDCTDKQNRVCVRHTSKDCDCFPKCRECGSAEHTSPMKSCYHTGFYHLGRMGGWTPAEDGMAADWHCCGCDDSNNLLGCDNHNEVEKCACFHCTECGSSEHRYPLPACRHRGSVWDQPHPFRRRNGGWNDFHNAWSCCNCLDKSNLDCNKHTAKECGPPCTRKAT